MLHVLWFVRFRDGGLTDLDEAGYVALGLREQLAWSDGFREFARTATETGTSAPLVPLVTQPFYAALGEGLPAAWTVMVLCFVWLALVTYALSRRFLPPGWALLATASLTVAPVVTDYTRVYHFALPAAAALTTSVWLLLRSDRLRDQRFAVLAGIALGVMLLTRIMTVAYAPAVVLAGALLVLRTEGSRRARVVNLGLLVAAAVVVAGPWYLRNISQVSAYLGDAGYGERSGDYGDSHSVVSPAFWLEEAGQLVLYLGLPFAVVTLTLLVSAVARRGWRGLDTERLVLIVVCAEGYLALTSTTNGGSAFALPWLPCFVILVVAAAAHVSQPRVRAVVAAALVVAGAGSVIAKNGVSSAFSEGRGGLPAVRLPPDDLAPIGLDVVQQGVFDNGLPVAVPPDEDERAWGDFNELLVRRVAAARMCVTPISGDWVLEGNRLRLASALEDLDACVDDVDASDAQSAVATARGILLTIDPVPEPLHGLDPAELDAAARAARYRVAETLTAPDGRRVRLWLRPPPP